MAERRSRVFRRCKMCLAVCPASEFKRADERPVYGALRLTRCPSCRRVCVLMDFHRVEQPTAADLAELPEDRA